MQNKSLHIINYSTMTKQTSRVDISLIQHRKHESKNTTKVHEQQHTQLHMQVQQ